MNYHPKRIKKTALAVLSGNWFRAIAYHFIYDIIVAVIGFFTSSKNLSIPPISADIDISLYAKPVIALIILGFISNILISPFRVGCIRCIMSLFYKINMPFFKIFSHPDRWPVIMGVEFIKLSLIALVSAYPMYILLSGASLNGVILLVWAVLIVFILLNFVFTNLILAEMDNINIYNTIRLSRYFLKGHTWHVINLTVSFLPWIILCGITAGIGLFLLEIYYTAALTVIYKTIESDIYKKNKLDVLL